MWQIVYRIDTITTTSWLVYNEPLTYAKLVFPGELAQYSRDMTGMRGLED